MARRPEEISPSFHTVRQVADRLGVHPETVRRLIHRGDLEAVRIGRVLRVWPESVERFLVERHVGRRST